MGAIIGLLVLAALGLAFVLTGYVMKNKYSNDDASLFGAGLVVLVFSMLALGVLIGENEVKNSKHKLTPVVKVECTNTKCDTTYIYSFKEDE